MKKIFLIGLLSLFLIGCATTIGPKNLTQEDISQKIIKGKTIKDEVKSFLGKPTSITISQYQMPEIDMTKFGGAKINMSEIMPYETWTYSKIKQHFFSIIYIPPEVTSLAVSFDKNGIVQSYNFFETK